MSNTILNLLLYHPTVKKISNLLLNQSWLIHHPLYLGFYRKRITRVIQKYQRQPFSVRIENTNYCNGHCLMCPHSTMKRNSGTMSRPLYQKIINQMSRHRIAYLNLHNFGEPLIDPDFVWRIKYAKQAGINRISTNTNGQLLTPVLSKKIIQSGLDEIYFSLDAFTPKTYSQIRVGLDYRTVVSNIHHFVNLKKALRSSTPKITVDFLKTDLNQKETQPFISYWSKLVDHVCISEIHDWSNKTKVSKNYLYQNYVSQSQTPCRLPFTELLINWDGVVSLCCQDTDGEVILGNANKEPLLSIWQNSKFQKVRRTHLSLKINHLPLCQNCKLRTFWWVF